MKKVIDEVLEFEKLASRFNAVLSSVSETERLKEHYDTDDGTRVVIRENHSGISYKWESLITYMGLEDKDYEIDFLKAVVRSRGEFIVSDRHKMIFTATETVLYYSDLKDDFNFFNHRVLLSENDFQKLLYASKVKMPIGYGIFYINIDSFDNLIYRKLMELPDE